MGYKVLLGQEVVNALAGAWYIEKNIEKKIKTRKLLSIWNNYVNYVHIIFGERVTLSNASI